MQIDVGDVAQQAKSIEDASVFYLNDALVVARPNCLDRVNEFLRDNFNNSSITVDARALSDVAGVVELLDRGASQVFVSETVLDCMVGDNAIEDLSRLVVGLGSNVQGSAKETATSKDRVVGGIVISDPLSAGSEEKILQTLDSGSMRVFAYMGEWSQETYSAWTEKGIIPIVPASALTVDHGKFPSKVPVHTLLLHGLQSDRPDGLWPTIILDELGTSLGLVYSSAASVAEAVKSGRGVYQSRKRKGLWVKGETSGDVQELISVGVDCDCDTLVFTVRQKGNGKSLSKILLWCLLTNFVI